MDNEKKVDEGWKGEAKKAKEHLTSEEAQEHTQEIPQANFLTLISGMATQTLISLGLVENPITKKVEKSLNTAKYTIDLLQVLEDKTKGNLTEDELKYLQSILYDLRMHYIRESSKE